MQRASLKEFKAAIEANTQRRSLEELQKQGKRHVRVVSGEKVMKIIEAVASDIIAREVGELTERDRERIFKQTQAKFNRVMQMQNEQERQLEELRDELRETAARAEEVQKDRDLLQEQLEAAKKKIPDSEALAETHLEVARVSASVRAMGRQSASAKNELLNGITALIIERDRALEARIARSEGEFEDVVRAHIERQEDARTSLVEEFNKTLASARFDEMRAQLETLQEHVTEQTAQRDRVGRQQADQWQRRIDEIESALQAVTERPSSDVLRSEVVGSVASRVIEHIDLSTTRRDASLRTLQERVDELREQIDELARTATAAPRDSARILEKRLDALEELLGSNARVVNETLSSALSRPAEELAEVHERLTALDSSVRSSTAATARSVLEPAEAVRGLEHRLVKLERVIAESTAATGQALQDEAAGLSEVQRRLAALQEGLKSTNDVAAASLAGPTAAVKAIAQRLSIIEQAVQEAAATTCAAFVQPAARIEAALERLGELDASVKGLSETTSEWIANQEQHANRLHSEFAELGGRITDAHASTTAATRAHTEEKVGAAAESVVTRIDTRIGELTRELAQIRQQIEDANSDGAQRTDAIGNTIRKSVSGLEQTVQDTRQTTLAAVSAQISAGRDDLRTQLEALHEGTLTSATERDAATRSAIVGAVRTDLEERITALAGQLAALHQGTRASATERDTATRSAIVGAVRTDLEQRITALAGQLAALHQGTLASATERDTATRSAIVGAVRTDLEQRITALSDQLDALHEGSAASATERDTAQRTAIVAAVRSDLEERIAGLTEQLTSLNEAATSSQATQIEAGAALLSGQQGIEATSQAAAASLAKLEVELELVRGELEHVSGLVAEGHENASSEIKKISESAQKQKDKDSDLLQQRFTMQLDDAITQIDKSLKRATAGPVEVTAVATSALLAKIFDADETELSSNLHQLEVEERKSSPSVSSQIERLRAMRSGGGGGGGGENGKTKQASNGKSDAAESKESDANPSDAKRGDEKKGDAAKSPAGAKN